MTAKYARITHQGKRLDAYTLAALKAAEADYGGTLTLTQGGYNAGGVAASAGTHDGGGVFDASVRGMKARDIDRAVLALRRNGFAAWHRPAIAGLWIAHIHAVQIGNAKRSAAAKRQVREYRAGRNGLANRGKDTGPRVAIKAYPWRKRPANVRAALKSIRAQQKHAGAVQRRRLQRAKAWLLKIKKR